MTEKEFRAYTEEFWSWVSKTDRPVTAWLSSMESWAAFRYHFEKQTEVKAK